jgi:hypothetical protein
MQCGTGTAVPLDRPRPAAVSPCGRPDVSKQKQGSRGTSGAPHTSRDNDESRDECATLRQQWFVCFEHVNGGT